MKKYIGVEEAEEAIFKAHPKPDEFLKELDISPTCFESGMRTALFALDKVEPIRIIRCKECRHWNIVSRTCGCNSSEMRWAPNDFCSHADQILNVEE